MAPKRPPSSGVGTPGAKKAKILTGQQSLDSFFRSPSSKSKRGSCSTTPQDPTLFDDQQLAEQLAENDGIDLEAARRLEDSWKHGLFRASKGVSDAMKVDVDVGGSQPHASAGMSTSLQPGNPQSRRLVTLSNPIDVVSPSSDLQEYEDLYVDPILFKASSGPPWSPGTPTPYSSLAHSLSMLSRTRSRIQILNVLTNFLRLVSLYNPQSLLPTLYLVSNKLSPPYSPTELGLGPSVISKALQQVSGLSQTALSKLYKKLGDPGDVAFAAKSSLQTLVPHPPLSIIGVYEALLKISRTQGQGAARQKQSIVENLLLSAKGEEIRYLVRTLCLNLRVGASQTTILSALARAMVLSPSIGTASTFCASPTLLSSIQLPSSKGKNKADSDLVQQKLSQLLTDAETLVKRCFVQHPNLDDIAAALLDFGLEGLTKRVPLTVGIPLLPTLGSPMRSLDEVYERLLGLPFTAEFKYDGQRAQVHGLQDDAGELSIKVFSRHLEDMTDKYPDVVALAKLLFTSNTHLTSFIVDAEIVAVEPDTGALRSFQDLSQRARKNVKVGDIKIAVCLYVFDLMYFNGQVLLEVPFRQRRDLLRERFPPLIPDEITVARLAHVESCESEDGRVAVETFWQKAVEGRAEGLMVKLLDSGEVTEMGKTRRKPFPATYEPDKRTSAWLKLKKDYVTGFGDSLDLVPIGGWHGMGRKVKWWSPVLLALYDPASGEFVAVSKCMTGFTDAFYKEMKARYPEESDTCSKGSRWDCRLGGFKPSVYFKPQEVWEIRGADITLSPVSVAAIDLVGEKGLSLRFPRFVKVREDKGLTQASTPQFLVDMWRKQESRGRDKVKYVDEGELLDAELDSESVHEELSS